MKRGFTVIELGIVIGIIAVLATVVFMGRGMIESARVGNGVQMFNDIRKASRSLALRANGGAAFNFGAPLGPLSLAALQAQNLLPNPYPSPWNAGIGVQALNATTIRIGICVPTAVLATDFDASLRSMNAAAGVQLLANVPGAACACGTCGVNLDTQ
jgi:prepilin-type N-terminal cleavage/methylation domain-containing protein